MVKTGGAIRNILIWTYERGTLPYDLICALILLFIFLVPRSCFTAKKAGASHAGSIETSQKDQSVTASAPITPKSPAQQSRNQK